MSVFQRIVNWLLRWLGMGQVAKLQSDLHVLDRTVRAGDHAAAMAQGQAIAGGAAPANAPNAPNAPMTSGQSAALANALARAMQDQQTQADRRLAARPDLIAPIEGVTLEQYAALAAAAAAAPTPAAFDRHLAQHGLDRARFDRVQAGWTTRMRDDGTHALMTIYGQAFGAAGTGGFGAAGAAGAASLGALGAGASAGAAGVSGAEPCTWERYNEIGGAQRAWAASGQDVNAMLRQHFGLSALDWSNLSQYWMARMMSDPQKMLDMNGLQEQWAARYAAPKADADLRF